MRNVPNLLALDLATSFGAAWGVASDGRPKFTSKRLGPPGSSDGRVGAALMRWLLDITSLERFDAIFIEKPMDPATAVRIGTQPATVKRLCGLVVLAETLAEMAGIARVEMVGAQQHKKFFTGRGAHSKEIDLRTGREISSREIGKRAVMDRCRQLGLDVPDDNAADAVSLWFYGSGKMLPETAALSAPLFSAPSA